MMKDSLPVRQLMSLDKEYFYDRISYKRYKKKRAYLERKILKKYKTVYPVSPGIMDFLE